MMLLCRPVFIAALLYNSAAAAHAMLEHAQPAAGAVVHQTPGALQLQFSEQLEPASSSATITDLGGQSVAGGPVSTQGTRITIPLKRLPPGEYRVHWQAVSRDTHRTQGNYSFVIAP